MSAPTNLDEFNEKFKAIAEMGWVTTHRANNTGIGKTLEDLLEIQENNINGPDFGDYELKAMRTNANSMLSLFTKSPEPPKVNALLLDTYGYYNTAHPDDKKLLTTLDSQHLSKLADSGKALGITFRENRVCIIDEQGNIPAYWEIEGLKEAFLKKYRYHLVHVYADSQGHGADEEFKFHTAWELWGFSADKLINFIKDGIIKVDIRIGRYPDGRPHDRGTGFRIQERYLSDFFANKRVLYIAD